MLRSLRRAALSGNLDVRVCVTTYVPTHGGQLARYSLAERLSGRQALIPRNARHGDIYEQELLTYYQSD